MSLSGLEPLTSALSGGLATHEMQDPRGGRCPRKSIPVCGAVWRKAPRLAPSPRRDLCQLVRYRPSCPGSVTVTVAVGRFRLGSVDFCRLFARVLVLVDVGSVEEGERVLLCCSRFGVVGDQGLSGCSVQRHALVAEVEVADVGVVERLAASVVRADVVAVPESGKLGTFHDQLTDDDGDIGCVRFKAGEGPKVGDAAAELAFPVVEQDSCAGVKEGVAPDIALGGRPVGDAGEEMEAAGVPGQEISVAADDMSRVGTQPVEQDWDPGWDGPAGWWRRRGGSSGSQRCQRAQVVSFVVLQLSARASASITSGLGRVSLPLSRRV